MAFPWPPIGRSSPGRSTIRLPPRGALARAIGGDGGALALGAIGNIPANRMDTVLAQPVLVDANPASLIVEGPRRPCEIGPGALAMSRSGLSTSLGHSRPPWAL